MANLRSVLTRKKSDGSQEEDNTEETSFMSRQASTQK